MADTSSQGTFEEIRAKMVKQSSQLTNPLTSGTNTIRHGKSGHSEMKDTPDVTQTVPKCTSDVNDAEVVPPVPPRTVKTNETAKKEGGKAPEKTPVDTSTHSTTTVHSSTAAHSATADGETSAPVKIPQQLLLHPAKKKETSTCEDRPDVTPAIPNRTSNVNDAEVVPPVPPRPVKINETVKKEGIKAPAKPPMDTSTHSTTTVHSSTSARYPTDNDCVLTVTGFEKSEKSEALKLHFENHRKSGGGPVESVHIKDAAAIVHFKHAADAQNVLGREQVFRKGHLSVAPYSCPEVSVQNIFVFSGLNYQTHEDMLRDFLESKTNCSVLDVKEYGQKGSFLLVFSEEKFPEFEKLQELCKKNTLDGSFLKVNVYQEAEEEYLEALMCEKIQITKGKMKFFEKYDSAVVRKEMDKLHVTFDLDKTNYTVMVHGVNEHIKMGKNSMESFLKYIHESELPFSMPGIVDFLKSEAAKAEISSIESGERCIIDVDDGIYQVILVPPQSCDGHNTESSTV